MRFDLFDRLRRASSPLEVDLVEHYARGTVSRREFVRRGAVIGLSMPFMAAVIAACGSDDERVATTSPAGTDGAPASGGTIRVASQSPAGPLDPVAMADLGSYGILAQSFEFLATLGVEDVIEPGLAESWTPNADGSEWTFVLRKGVKWHTGGDFTADDVVATMERLVTGGNAALSGVLASGGAKATDPHTVVFSLEGPNGQFPYLVSVYNAQAVITPKDWAAGTTLDGKPDGTGPWKLTSYNQATGATFVRNDDWWGGRTPLDGVEWVFSDDISTQVTGVQGGATDAIVQFSVLGGDALLNDANFNVLAAQTSTHRQVWMRCDEGQFTDKRVRQAIALSFDRDLMVRQLFQGRADIGNDHPVAPVYPFYDPSTPAQRTKDVEKAKQLLAEAGVSGLSAVLNAPKLQEIPELAQLVQSGAKEIGVEITLNIESTDTFYNQWCLTYDPICDGGQEFGIVDYGHRPTPDTFLNAAYATGVWNSAHYQSDEFNAAFKEYQAALEVDGQRAACAKMQNIANEDVPYGIPYFYNYLSGHNKTFTGVRVSALGQMFLDRAAKTA